MCGGLKTHTNTHTCAGKTPPLWQQPLPLLPVVAFDAHMHTHTCMHTRRKHTFKFLLTCKSALAFHAKHSHLIYSSVELSLIPVYGSDSSRGVMVWLQPLLKNTHRHTLLDVVTNELRCSKVLITLVEALCRSHPTHNVSLLMHMHTHCLSWSESHDLASVTICISFSVWEQPLEDWK